MAYKMISQERFYRALKAEFGKQVAQSACHECELGVFAPHHYVPADWKYPPNQPNIMYGKQHDGVTGVLMERGSDGVWRIGRIFPPRRPLPPEQAKRVAAAIAAEQQRQTTWEQKFDAVIAGVEKRKYPTTAAVIGALFPQGSPMEQQRAAEKEQKEYAAAQKRQLLAAHFDPSTLRGAIGAYMQAWMKDDAAGMAKFFYAQDDLKGRLAKASAERIVSAQKLQDAVNSHIADSHQAGVIGELESPLDAPWWADVQQPNGTGTASSRAAKKSPSAMSMAPGKRTSPPPCLPFGGPSRWSTTTRPSAGSPTIFCPANSKRLRKCVLRCTPPISIRHTTGRPRHYQFQNNIAPDSVGVVVWPP
jgi:hypothetical protein